MSFALVNLGCKVNRVDSDYIASHLIRLGQERASLAQADFVIINTCTVTAEAEKKTRKAARRALRENPSAPVYMTGCAVAIGPESLAAMSPRILVEPDKAKLLVELNECYGAPAPGPCPALFSTDGQMLRMGAGFPTRVGIKVQDGCDQKCSYCIVNRARGKPWSRPLGEIEEEVALYAKAGVKELVLTGINLGSYSFEGTNLSRLLERLLACSDGMRFRISSIEPTDIDPALAALIAQSDGRLCAHLHLPLQSGSSKVLHEMARPYDREAYLEKVEMLYRQMAHLSLSTDMIVGFPGESDADFEESLEVARLCRFSKIHVFPYSKRAGTPAASREDQLAPKIKAARVARLIALGESLRAQDYAARSGKEEKVLVEREGRGLTESYYHIDVPPKLEAGCLVRISLPASHHDFKE